MLEVFRALGAEDPDDLVATADGVEEFGEPGDGDLGVQPVADGIGEDAALVPAFGIMPTSFAIFQIMFLTPFSRRKTAMIANPWPAVECQCSLGGPGEFVARVGVAPVAALGVELAGVEGFGIAVKAARVFESIGGGDHGAAEPEVPGGVAPLDVCLLAHKYT